MKEVNRIYLSGDHAGFKAKERIKKFLEKKGYGIIDFGPERYNKTDDYPDFVIPMAKALVKDSKKENIVGLIFAGSGEGEAIAANKVEGIRAAVYHGKNLNVIKATRQDNNSNVLCIGARFVKEPEIKKAVTIFLNTKFEGGRHKRRLQKISKMTKK